MHDLIPGAARVVEVAGLPSSRQADFAILDDAASVLAEESAGKSRITPASKMTRSDASVFHFLTEGELARIENAWKHGGSTTVATLVYGAAIGIAAPFMTAGIRLFSEGAGQLAPGDFVTLFLGSVTVGATIVVWCIGTKDETVGTICKEYRERPSHDVD